MAAAQLEEVQVTTTRRVTGPAGSLALLVTLLASLTGTVAEGLPVGAPADANLAAGLAAAAPTDELVVIASTSGLPTQALVAAVEVTGADVAAYTHIPALALRGTPAELAAVATVAGIEGLWLDTPLTSTLAQSVALIQADAVHAPPYGFTGAGVAVAVLDSGIDGTHPDLAYPDKTVQNVKLLGNQHVFEDLTFTVEDVPDTDTTTGHGTHVAGIVAGDGSASDGLYAGVAPGASLVGVGAADGVEMLTALAGYDWILEHHEEYGIRVINNSWADGGIEYDPDHPLNRASKAAHDAGIVVVFAAGNDGQQSGDVFNRYAWPDWVISVGGGTKTGQLGDYSSRGTAAHHADLIAPGSFIASTIAKTGVVGLPNQSPFDLTDPLQPRVIAPEHLAYYSVKIGTSMAAPHVAGVAALLLEADPTLTPDEVRDVLVATATPVPGCAVVDCGAGYVNALAAVQAVVAGSTTSAPTADLVVTPTSGAAPLTVTLDASGSADQDGNVVSYRFDTDGDGLDDVTQASPVLTVTYDAGAYRPSVVVRDDDGLDSARARGDDVRASDPPVAVATAPTHARAGVAVTFDASGSSDPNGDALTYRFLFGDGTEVTTTTATVTHTYTASRPIRHGWVVEVSDTAGLRDAVGGSLRVTPSG